MKRKPYLFILMGLLSIGFLVACLAPFSSNLQPETETSSPTVSPTATETKTPAPTSTKFVTSTPEFSPYCENDNTDALTPSQCQLPIAEQSSIFCNKKTPYNLLLINEGATYQVLTKKYVCSDAGMKDSKKMVTCTGQMASTYEVQVCDPGCAIPTVQAEITQCPENYFYDTFQGCCTQELQVFVSNCVVLKLETTSCIVDCGLYNKKKKCDNHSYACYWDDINAACKLRK